MDIEKVLIATPDTVRETEPWEELMVVDTQYASAILGLDFFEGINANFPDAAFITVLSKELVIGMTEEEIDTFEANHLLYIRQTKNSLA